MTQDSGHAVSRLSARQTQVWNFYLGITSDLPRRVHQHKTKAASGFTATYGVDRLVWFETHDDPTAAIAREKALKKWRRDWKIRLIEEQNPDWQDLFPTIIG
jgi:putative endonuclease